MTSIYQNALESFGKKKHTNKNWFEENINVLLPLIKIKRQAHVDYQHDPSSTSLKRLREARKTFRKTARKCANEFWLKTSAGIQAAADRGDTKSVYDGIRQRRESLNRKKEERRASKIQNSPLYPSMSHITSNESRRPLEQGRIRDKRLTVRIILVSSRQLIAGNTLR